MQMHFKKILAAALLAGSSLATAAPVPGSGGGYYGSAWFTNQSGIVVGAYPTWAECDYYFQQALTIRVQEWGYTVSELNPCSYKPPFGSIQFEIELGIRVDPSSPVDSLDDSFRILGELKSVREQFRADEYEQALMRIR